MWQSPELHPCWEIPPLTPYPREMRLPRSGTRLNFPQAFAKGGASYGGVCGPLSARLFCREHDKNISRGNGPCAILCGRLSGLVSILHPSAELRGVPDLMAPERHPLPHAPLPRCRPLPMLVTGPCRTEACLGYPWGRIIMNSCLA